MINLLKDKTNIFLLAVSLLLLGIIFFIVILNFSSESTPDTVLPTPTPVTGQTTRPSTPVLHSTISQTKQGVFTVTFPKAPNPAAITITLASSTLDPSSPTETVPFTSTFQEEGKLLVITTNQSLQDNSIYTLYVRLRSNNHIIVKHRYESNNGTLTIIDND